jgi:hypothetical protein
VWAWGLRSSEKGGCTENEERDRDVMGIEECALGCEDDK